MPDIQTSLEYLKDLPLYGLEKPYYCLQPADDGLDPDEGGCHNLEFEIHTNIPIKDIRGYEDEYRLEDCGFEVLSYTSEVPNLESVDEIESPEVIAQYRADTERLLRAKLGACFVRCYDSILRKNVVFNRTRFDIRDPLHTEGPAQGAHNDVTYKSGPEIISRNMKAEEQEEFLRPGNRVRIVNTWRSILPVLEDRPLALCDSRSVEASDLVACDRIIPDRVGEVYYLKHNPNHKWYWLSGQTSTEPFAFVMYDTKAGTHARCLYLPWRRSTADLAKFVLTFLFPTHEHPLTLRHGRVWRRAQSSSHGRFESIVSLDMLPRMYQ